MSKNTVEVNTILILTTVQAVIMIIGGHIRRYILSDVQLSKTNRHMTKIMKNLKLGRLFPKKSQGLRDFFLRDNAVYSLRELSIIF